MRRGFAVLVAVVAVGLAGCTELDLPAGRATASATRKAPPVGKAPTGKAPTGKAPTGKAPTGKAPTGSASATGDAPVVAVAPATVARAKADLARLRVAAERDGGYDRTRDFGPAWSVDVNRNGCGTRDDILRRDLGKVQLRGRCTVVAGVLADPYTGRTVVFAKSDAAKVQIDHVVPLGAAWSRGARDWPQATRERFANDPANLLATTGSANQSKSDRGPARWLPRVAYRCAYAVLWIRVSAAYGLVVTPPDKAGLTTVLVRC